jgi:hypothetical protein
VYMYAFKIEPCSRMGFWIYCMLFWSTYLSAIFHIYDFVYLANEKKNGKRIVYSFILFLIIHYFVPFIIYIPSGRLFPMNLVPFLLAWVLSFGAVINKENWKQMLKFLLGIVIFYLSLVICLFFPVILPYLKIKLKEYFPFAVTILIHSVSICTRLGVGFVFIFKFIAIEHLFNSLVFSSTLVNTFEFVYFLKSDLNSFFYINNLFNLFTSTLGNLGFFDNCLKPTARKLSEKFKCLNFLKTICCLGNEKKFVEFNDYIVGENLIIKLLMMMFYFTFDKIGIIFHPENSRMDSCRMEWKYRCLIDKELFRLILYFIFTIFLEYFIIFLWNYLFKVKRCRFYKNLELRVVFISGCCIFAIMHFVFQFTFVFM